MVGSLSPLRNAMDLGVFVEPVIKPLAWLSKKFFLAAYDASSAYYWQHEGVHTDWRRLGGMIECDAGLIGVVSDTGPPSYLLALRAVPGTPLKRVEIIVKAKNSLASRKARIVIEDLGQVPVALELPSLPSAAVPLNDNAVEPYEAIYLLLVEAISTKGAHLAFGKKIMGRLTPKYRESLNAEYVMRWGRYWHVGWINEEKHRLKIDLFWKIVMSAGQLWRPLTIRRAIFQLLTNEFALSLAFWSRNLVSARQMKSANVHLDNEKHHSAMTAEAS